MGDFEIGLLMLIICAIACLIKRQITLDKRVNKITVKLKEIIYSLTQKQW